MKIQKDKIGNYSISDITRDELLIFSNAMNRYSDDINEAKMAVKEFPDLLMLLDNKAQTASDTARFIQETIAD